MLPIRRMLSPFLYPEKVLLAEQFSYGHREAILASNKLDPSSIFLASIPHGWGPDSPGIPYPKTFSRRFQEYPVLTWSERSTIDLKSRGYRMPLTAGSPWAHLLTSIYGSDQNALIDQSRTQVDSLLYFPSHSIPGANHLHDSDVSLLLKSLRPKKITVCLFWLDFINPKVRELYERYNFELVCVGFKGSTGFDVPWAPIGGREIFLATLFKLISTHDIIACETISTPFWYAASLRKKLFLTSPSASSTWWGESRIRSLKINNLELLELVGAELVKLDLNQVILPSDYIQHIAMSELGWSHTSDFSELIQKHKLLKVGVLPHSLVEPMLTFVNSESQIFRDSK